MTLKYPYHYLIVIRLEVHGDVGSPEWKLVQGKAIVAGDGWRAFGMQDCSFFRLLDLENIVCVGDALVFKNQRPSSWPAHAATQSA